MRSYIGMASADAHKAICMELDALGRVLEGIGTIGFSEMGAVSDKDKLCKRLFARVEILVSDLEALDNTDNDTDN